MASCDVKLRTWTRGSDDDARTGLLGFVSVLMGGVVVDGITVRKTETGKLTLSFPERKDRLGRRHAIVRPIDNAARLAIEKAVFGAAAVAEAVNS